MAGLLAALWASTLLWTYHFAINNAHHAVEASKVPLLVASIERHNQQADAGQRVEEQTITHLARTESNFQKLDQKVMNYAQKHAGAADCSLDADGLRAWAEANANSIPDADSGGEPVGPMPGPAAPGERQDYGPAGQPRAGGQAVPPVPGQPSGPGTLDQGDAAMTDFADDALQSEEEARQRALVAQQARAGLRDKTVDDSATECTVCDEPIPQARREVVPGVQTCFACQGELERAMQAHTRGYP